MKKLNFSTAGPLLASFELRRLFIDELGWDRLPGGDAGVSVDGQDFKIVPIAQKRGVQVFECTAENSHTFPSYPQRQKLERHVRKTAHEHLIIFTDEAKTRQVWQWVARGLGRPAAYREHSYYSGQSPQATLQRLEPITFLLPDEEMLTLSGVTAALAGEFDKEAVTRRFYDRFKSEHASFLGAIEGIPEAHDREWYASLMLNRLMFVYFVQKKRFLNGDVDYLRSRLDRAQSEAPKSARSFYRDFLLRLFHDGLGAQPPRSRDLKSLLGEVPYMNGGLFEVHAIESTYPDIDIPNDAFSKLFRFFDEYTWHLDERPLSEGNEINPDVLGYIFEKYINQKQMGAYYTQEDITEYITESTVLPVLLARAQGQCRVAFEPDAALWQRVALEPWRYIRSTMRRGVMADNGTLGDVPDEIREGQDNVEARSRWNEPARPDVALPLETWREFAHRRSRCLQLAQSASTGEFTTVDALLAANLDLRQFVQDAIDECEGPEFLRAVFRSLVRISVLDPTCGSGAFLFAALSVLEPIYEACLDRMQAFIEDAGEDSVKYADFRETLATAARHPNRRYYVLKSIMINNLFGVDIMDEAVEICKLRLFLKLVAQVGRASELEPLPDIDFNIRSGNTLVGFTSFSDIERHLSERLDLDNKADQVLESASRLDQKLTEFRRMQEGAEVTHASLASAKKEVNDELLDAERVLDEIIACDYGVRSEDEAEFGRWRRSHDPFHWLIEFHHVLAAGGFDCVVGNPPYVELKSVTEYALQGYRTLDTGNLYPMVMERSLELSSADGRLGFIVPVSSISTDGYASLQRLLPARALFSSYDDRPSRLFDGLEHSRLTIHLLQKQDDDSLWLSTRYRCWRSEERPALFGTTEYAQVHPSPLGATVAKISEPVEQLVLDRIWSAHRAVGTFTTRGGGHTVFYSRKIGHFLQVLDFVPEVYTGDGKLRPPSEFKALSFASDWQAGVVFCALNSNLFRWFVNVYSDCRHVNKREVEGFPLNLDAIRQEDHSSWMELAAALSESLRANSEFRTMRFKHDQLKVQCIIPRRSKSLIDEVDYRLAPLYGFTDDAVDFLVNYAYKYRMGD